MENILITGPPRIGKTTLINNIIKKVNFKIAGFTTKEILENNYRIGFSIETFSGKSLVLASKKNKSSKYFVGKYGVFLENLDIIMEEIKEEFENKIFDLIVIDEIGKMELFSLKFKGFILDILDEKKLFGSIMLKDNDFTKNIKNRNDVKIFHLDEKNRLELEVKILELLKEKVYNK